MQEFRVRTSRRPQLLPADRWAVMQRWNDILFAHWPVDTSVLTPLIPDSLDPDSFQGSAWLGISASWIDQMRIRALVPRMLAHGKSSVAVRTYVRERTSGIPGMLPLSIDTDDLFSLLLGRAIQSMPYFWAELDFDERSEREFQILSSRRLAAKPVRFSTRYRTLGPTVRSSRLTPGSLEHFLMERSVIFRRSHAGGCRRANMHHVSGPLEEAEAEIEQNDLAAALGIQLPPEKPVCHFLRRMALYVWPAEETAQRRGHQPLPAEVVPLV